MLERRLHDHTRVVGMTQPDTRHAPWSRQGRQNLSIPGRRFKSGWVALDAKAYMSKDAAESVPFLAVDDVCSPELSVPEGTELGDPGSAEKYTSAHTGAYQAPQRRDSHRQSRVLRAPTYSAMPV